MSSCLADVRRNASLTVGASTARPAAGEITLLSMLLLSSPELMRFQGESYQRVLVLPQSDPGPRQRRDVVGQADHEDHQNQHESDHTGALHDLEGDPLAPDLLGHGPEHMAPVEGQEREQVDDRERK